MPLDSNRSRVAGSALTTPHFLLLYAAMLVAAAGNTALQSVMPAIGREIGISDFWVTVSYTWSAVLWVTLAPFWARKSDRHGRKNLTLLGVGGFIASMTLCGLVLAAGLRGALAGGLTFAALPWRAHSTARSAAPPPAPRKPISPRGRGGPPASRPFRP
jgi:MFS family permease